METSTQAGRHHKIKVKIKPDVGSARPSYPEGSMAAATRLAEVLHAQDRAACVRRSAEIKLARTHPCGKRIPLGGSQDQLRTFRVFGITDRDDPRPVAGNLNAVSRRARETWLLPLIAPGHGPSSIACTRSSDAPRESAAARIRSKTITASATSAADSASRPLRHPSA